MGYRVLAMVLAAAAAVGVCSGPAFAGSIDRRERRQIQRIGAGVYGGQLTPRETRRLLDEQAWIRAEEDRYRRTGGGLSAWERWDLQQDLNRSGWHISVQFYDQDRRHWDRRRGHRDDDDRRHWDRRRGHRDDDRWSWRGRGYWDRGPGYWSRGRGSWDRYGRHTLPERYSDGRRRGRMAPGDRH